MESNRLLTITILIVMGCSVICAEWIVDGVDIDVSIFYVCEIADYT